MNQYGGLQSVEQLYGDCYAHVSTTVILKLLKTLGIVEDVRNEQGKDQTYKTDLDVRQFGKNGQVIRRYKIIGAFPTTVDAIDLNWETQNQIETFGVTFSYDYWYPDFAEVVTPGDTDLRYDY